MGESMGFVHRNACVGGGTLPQHRSRVQRVWGTLVLSQPALLWGTPHPQPPIPRIPRDAAGFPAQGARLPPRSLMTVINSLIPCGASLFRGGARGPREQGGELGGVPRRVSDPPPKVLPELLLQPGTRGVGGQHFGERTHKSCPERKESQPWTREHVCATQMCTSGRLHHPPQVHSMHGNPSRGSRDPGRNPHPKIQGSRRDSEIWKLSLTPKFSGLSCSGWGTQVP